MKKTFICVLMTVLGTCMAGTAWAQELIIPHTFESGTKALASEVNENFAATATAVNNNRSYTQANTADNLANTAAIADNSTAIADNGTAIAGNSTAIANNNTAITNIDEVSAGNADAVSTLSDSMMLIEMETLPTHQVEIDANALILADHTMALQGNTDNINTNTTAIIENSNAINVINTILPQYQPLRVLANGVDIGLFLQAPPTIDGAPFGDLLIAISDAGYLFGVDMFTAQLMDHDVIFASGDCTGQAYSGSNGKISEVMSNTGYVFRASGPPTIDDQGYFIPAGSTPDLFIQESRITPDGSCEPLASEMVYVYPVFENSPGTTGVGGAAVDTPIRIGRP